MKQVEITLALDVAAATSMIMLSLRAQKEFAGNPRLVAAAKAIGCLGQAAHELLGEPVSTVPQLKVHEGGASTLCGGCAVREPFEHRCHGQSKCACPECWCACGAEQPCAEHPQEGP